MNEDAYEAAVTAAEAVGDSVGDAPGEALLESLRVHQEVSDEAAGPASVDDTNATPPAAAPEVEEPARKTRLGPWLARAFGWVVAWTCVCLAALAFPYEEGGKHRHRGKNGILDPHEARLSVARLAAGAGAGLVLRGGLFQAPAGGLLESVVFAAEGLALDALCAATCTALGRFGRRSFLPLPRPVDRRLMRLLCNVLFVAVTYVIARAGKGWFNVTSMRGVETDRDTSLATLEFFSHPYPAQVITEVAAQMTLKRWTKAKFVERVDRAAGEYAVLRKLATACAEEARRLSTASTKKKAKAPTLGTPRRRWRPGPLIRRRDPATAALGPMTLGPLGQVDTVRDARAAGRGLFRLARRAAASPSAAAVPRSAVRAMVVDATAPEDEGASFDALFPEASGDAVDAEAFAAAAARVFAERRLLAATMASTGNIVGLVKTGIVAVWAVFSVFFTALAWHADLSGLALTLATIVIARAGKG